MGNDNYRGWYHSDGVTYVYNGDYLDYSNEYMPTIDPYRMPGTTVSRVPRNDGHTGPRFLSNYNQTGGTDLDGIYGVASMHVDNNVTTIDAKKSWFMFDDEMVALGAGISADDDCVVETTIDNRMMSAEGDNRVLINGQECIPTANKTEAIEDAKWIHYSGTRENADIGYIIPGGAKIFALRDNRIGRWRDISGAGTEDPIEKTYFTMWYNHGINPDNASYQYAILPGKTPEKTEAYYNNPDFTVLCNDLRVQAVRENKLGVTGAIFWEPIRTSLDFMTVSSCAAVMVKQADGEVTVSVSDQTQKNTEGIDIELRLPVDTVVKSNPNVTVTKTDYGVLLHVDTKDSHGKSFSVTLS